MPTTLATLSKLCTCGAARSRFGTRHRNGTPTIPKLSQHYPPCVCRSYEHCVVDVFGVVAPCSRSVARAHQIKRTLSWQRVRSIPVLATLCPRAQSAAWNNRSAASPCSRLNVLSLESLRAAPLPAQGRPCLAYTAPSTKCQCLHRERCVDKTLVNNAAVW